MNASVSPIQIKRTDLVLDIRDLAARKGLPITDAVAEAVRAELDRLKTDREVEIARKRAAVEAILAEVDALPVVGEDLTDGDLYDQLGLPR